MADPGLPTGGRQPGGKRFRSVIRPNFPENCMKMNKNHLKVASVRPKFVYVGPPLQTTYLRVDLSHFTATNKFSMIFLLFYHTFNLYAISFLGLVPKQKVSNFLSILICQDHLSSQSALSEVQRKVAERVAIARATIGSARGKPSSSKLYLLIYFLSFFYYQGKI